MYSRFISDTLLTILPLPPHPPYHPNLPMIHHLPYPISQIVPPPSLFPQIPLQSFYAYPLLYALHVNPSIPFLSAMLSVSLCHVPHSQIPFEIPIHCTTTPRVMSCPISFLPSLYLYQTTSAKGCPHPGPLHPPLSSCTVRRRSQAQYDDLYVAIFCYSRIVRELLWNGHGAEK